MRSSTLQLVRAALSSTKMNVNLRQTTLKSSQPSRFFNVDIKSTNIFSSHALNLSSSRSFSTTISHEETMKILSEWSVQNQEGMKYLQGTTDTELTQAERCFREATNKASLFPRLPYRSLSMANLASCMMRRGRVQDAIHMFRHVVMELPRFPQVPPQQIATVYSELSTAYSVVGELDNSIRELHHASTYFIRECERLIAQISDSNFTGEPRTQALGQAINAWRSAIAMRMSIGSTMHKKGDLESARDQFIKVSAEVKVFHTALAKLTKLEDPPSVLDFINEGSPTLPSVTTPLLSFLPEMDLETILKPLTQALATDYWTALQSVGACQLDLKDVPEAIETYKDCVRFISLTDDDNFMRVLSEVCHAMVGTHEQITQESIGIHEDRNVGAKGYMTREQEDELLAKNELSIEAIEEARHHIFGSLGIFQQRLYEFHKNRLDSSAAEGVPQEEFDMEEFFKGIPDFSKEELHQMMRDSIEDARLEAERDEAENQRSRERAELNALRRKGIKVDLPGKKE